MPKVNPIKGNGKFPFSNNTPKKVDVPTAGKVVPPKSNTVGNATLPTSPRAGAVRRPAHTGRNIIITAALALVTLAVVKGVKGVKDYKVNHKAENVKEVIK